MSADILRSSEFVTDAVALIVKEARKAIEERGVFRLGLCGGSTPRAVYAALANVALPWEKVQITFGDERCVPPEDAQSNYRMANETLLTPAGIPKENIFRMKGELDPARAAEEYEQLLAAEAARTGETRYRHDLLLLGMGDDGHTASLFPETAALEEMERNVVANFVPKLNAYRITFTFPLINAARHVCFLVNDPRKEPVFQQVLAKSGGYPSERVTPVSGRLTWILGDGK